MILTKLMFIFGQKGTTFINTCSFGFDLELTLLFMSKSIDICSDQIQALLMRMSIFREMSRGGEKNPSTHNSTLVTECPP